MIDDFRPAPRRKVSLETNRNLTTKAAPQPTPEPFKTPEQVAAQPAPIRLPEHLDLPDSTPVQRSRKKALGEKLKLRWPPTKKEALVFVAVALIVSSGLGGYILTRQNTPVAAEPKPKRVRVVPKPTTVASTLSGLQVEPAVNARPVIGVMIENSQDARPQSGLGQAGVVFEAIAEGGITRFLALFQDTAPADIGPVRSVRPYYVQWSMGFDAPLAHVGGSPDALANIKEWGTKDLDQFFNPAPYRRSADRQAPHNVYTSYEGLQGLAAGKGYTGSTFTAFSRKKDAASKQPDAKTIDISISSALYNSHYDYDALSNSYRRSQAGAPHMDALSNTQISPKSVVVLVMPYTLNGKYSVYGTIGSGQAIVFQDGVATQASWVKADNNSQFNFTDANGQPLNLNAGQTWITVVSDPAKVTYTP